MEVDMLELFRHLITERSLFPILAAFAAACQDRAQMQRMMYRMDGHTCWQERARRAEQFFQEAAFRLSSIEPALTKTHGDDFPVGVLKLSLMETLERFGTSPINEDCPGCHDAIMRGEIVRVPSADRSVLFFWHFLSLFLSGYGFGATGFREHQSTRLPARFRPSTETPAGALFAPSHALDILRAR
jgi:hypothetical protein